MNVGCGGIEEAEDLCDGLSFGLFDVSEFLGGVDVEEVSFFTVAQAVGFEDGVEGFADGDVGEGHGDGSADFLGGQDVLVGAGREHLEHADEVSVMDLEAFDDAGFGEFDLGGFLDGRTGFDFGGSGREGGGARGDSRGSIKYADDVAGATGRLFRGCRVCRDGINGHHG